MEDNETLAYQNSEEEIENPDNFSYLTEAHQERGPVRLLITVRLRAVDTAPRRQDTTESQPAESYLSEAPKCSSTYQGGSLIVTGQFKFIYGSP